MAFPVLLNIPVLVSKKGKRRVWNTSHNRSDTGM